MDFTDQTIGPYHVLSRLGEGAMGVVYRAVDSRLNRPVAIKFLQKHLWTDAAARKRMTAEAHAASRVEHPNIATIYEIGDTPETGLYIVMAYYSGELLTSRLRGGALSVEFSVDVIRQIAHGLACAHDHGVIHRDIKPDNIMLTQNGYVKILDFGVAKSSDVHLTTPGTILGTPAFMPPEQILGDPVDHRCDLWSLGVMLYRMTTGKMPFQAATLPMLTAEILRSSPDLTVAPELVRPVLEKALMKDRAHRIHSAREFIALLDGASTRENMRAAHSWDGSATVTVGSSSLQRIGPFSPPPPVPTLNPTGSQDTHFGTREFRQVTLVSCELLDPAEIEASCGLEALQQLELGYEKICADTAERAGAEISLRGDFEIRLQFGYNRSQEDDPVRAVSAAQEILDAVRGLLQSVARSHPDVENCAIAARACVHTGSVIAIRDQAQVHSRNVFGSTGAVASRVLQAGRPGVVTITADTLQLVRKAFVVKEREGLDVRGSSSPVLLYEVLGAASAEDAGQSGNQAIALLSRDRELGALMDCWSETKEGHAQSVLIIGEPGIGKSRLVDEFRSRVRADEALILTAKAAQYYINSSLHPVLEMLRRVFTFERGDSPELQLRKLQNALARLRIGAAEGLAVMAPLLSLPVPANIAVPRLEPQRQLERNFSVIIRILEACAAQTPLIWILEDLHWADPSTVELVGRIVERARSTRILLLATVRPDQTPVWAKSSHLRTVNISKFSRRDAEALIRNVAGGKRLPPEMVARLIENADGVPLFIEELTRDVLSSGVLRQTEEGYELASPNATLAVPRTLKDALMARLDRMGAAKSTAQLASVLGRTFSQAWLEAISPFDAASTQLHLQKLADAGILFQQRSDAEVEYSFKHALLKDAAYQSMLGSDRRSYHAQFAHRLQQSFPDVVELHPELLAHHCTHGGLHGEAIVCWRRAGDDARRRSANLEAAAHYTNALELTPSLTDQHERTQTELGLWMSLASAQLATDGYGATRVGASFRRVRELGQISGSSRPLFDALQGEWAYEVVRSNLGPALEAAVLLEDIAKKLEDPALRLEAILRRGITLAMLGELQRSRAALEEVVAGSAVFDHRGSALLFGQDRLVACLCHLALVLCVQGKTDEAVRTAQRAVALANELNHAFSTAWAYLYAALVHTLCGDPAQTRDYADSLKLVCDEQGFSYRLAQSEVLGGWAVVTEFGDSAGLTELRKGIAHVFATGAQVYRTLYAALSADACATLGDVDSAVDTIEAELSRSPRTEEKMFEALLLCLHAELLHRSGRSKLDQVRQSLTSAATIARAQGAALFEIRALLGLASSSPPDAEALSRMTELLPFIESGGMNAFVESARAKVAGVRV